MSVIECVPLAGPGLVGRRGGLVVVSDGLGPGPDPLLAALDAVADSGGDGAALVRAGTRAALERGGRPAWACAGVTSGGEVAVLAHGAAAALVSVDGGPPTELAAGDSMIPVARTFTGAVVTVRLIIGGAAGPDPRLRLDAGIILGGGVALTISQAKIHGLIPNGPCATPVPTARPSVGQAAADTVLPRPGPGPATPFPADPFAHPAGPAAPGPAARVPAGPDAESWFRAQARPAGPTIRMQADGASADGSPEALIADPAAIRLEPLGSVEPVVVDGAMCARMHFNPPDATRCRECGDGMGGGFTRNIRRRPRPPLGVLLVDDGRGYLLDRDYVIGREPLLDDDVAAGRATPLPVTDADGTVSRLHLRVALVGWRVEVRDLGSANGSVLSDAGGSRTLAPADAVLLDPGARVGIGRRNVQFLAYGASAPSASPRSATPDGATP